MKFKNDIEVQAGIKDSSGSDGTLGQVLSSTVSGVSWITPPVGITGSGTTNFLPKWSSSTGLTNSRVIDNGVGVFVGYGSVGSGAGYALNVITNGSNQAGMAISSFNNFALLRLETQGTGDLIQGTSSTSASVFLVDNSGNTTANSFIKLGGTSSQYLMADGSVTTGPVLTGYVPYAGATQDVDLGIHQLKADSLAVSTTSTEAVDVGEIVWNAIDGTFDMGLIGGVTLQAGQELHIYGKATEVVSNGQAVMFAGVQGDHILISKADAATINSNPEYLIGVATQDFATNDFGYVTVFGNVRGLDTTAYTLGSVLYYDSTTATDGLLTATMPTAPNAKIEVAAVVKVHATQGILLVRPHVMPKLKDVQDVYAPTPSNEDGLWWNTANSRYENNSIEGILGYTPADDDQVVKLTGDQTIEGLKTFSSTVSAPIFELDANNAIGSNSNYIGQTMATNDSWKIYGNTIATDRGEMVFELGDNASASSSNGQRFNFYYNNTSSGTAKSPFILDYNDAIFDTNASFTGNISLSNGSYYKVGSINLVNDTQYIPKATTLGYFINSLLYDNGTNVGIGTDLPNEKLEVNGYILSNNGSYGGKVSLGSSSGPYISGNALTGQLGLSSSAGSPSMIIDIAGRVGIGTINPSKKLVVDGGSSDYLPIWAKSSLLASSKYYSSLLVGYALTSNQSTQFGYVYDTVTPTNSYAHITPFGSLEGSKFMVRADGNVGIGTVDPIGKLNIFTGFSGLTANPSSQTNGSISFGNNSSGSAVPSIIGKSNDNTGISVIAATNNTNAGTDFSLNVRENDNTDFSTLTSSAFRFSRYATPLVDILRNGNVGIGTTNPLAILTTANTGNLTLNSNDGDHTGFGLYIQAPSTTNSISSAIGFGVAQRKLAAIAMQSYADADQAGLNFYVQPTASGSSGILTEAMRINSNGRVGIGSAGGSSLLQLTNDGTFPQLILQSTTGVGWRFSESLGTLTVDPVSGATRTIKLTNSGSGSLTTIVEEGNVLIGTTTDSGYKLDVNGTGRFADTIRGQNNAIFLNSSTNILNIGSDQYMYGGTNSDGGIFVYGNNKLHLSTNSVRRLTVDGSGNVGIGTASPITKLDVNGSIKYANKAYYSTTAPVGNSGTLAWTLQDCSGVNVTTTSTNKVYRLQLTTIATGTNTGEVWIAQNIDAAGWSVKRVSSSVLTPSSNVPYMFVDTDGLPKVTIIHASSYYVLISVEEYNGGNNGTTYGVFGLDSQISSVGGNVGIGTTNPNETLTLYKSDRPYLQFVSATTGTSVTDGTALGFTTAAGEFQIRNKEAQAVTISTSDTERMRITSGGNVDINSPTVNASEPLRVKGAGAVSKYGIFVQLNSSAAIGYPMRFWNEASNSAVGSITMNSASTSYNTSSDYRLKEDIKPIENALERLQNLKPVNFAWKVDGSRVDGFIAHELANVIPSAVSGEKDATEEVEVTPAVLDEEGNVVEEAVFETRDVYQGIDQSKIVPLLVAAIQEQQEIIKQLENRIINLENK